ncbi:ABC transporter substrate-binding protein [Chitinivibrio alkaliphilus]|uniref:ABC transporter, metall binding protein n=1 Tax=Chitinivibrio alkaliphilus ACht1 TaxID=1313304 RepID=U7D571_9BACT|nr:ABC transporter substrate-binding protein [Chitinivibrio alkaliphilus]ERP31669.1 ABC transporter, metall binding protein [Chitinivibrio alkaliphilus ACht1]
MRQLLLLILLFIYACTPSNDTEDTSRRMVTDALGREVTIPAEVNHIICSGAGALRYATYLELQDMVVAVDNAEKSANPALETRPYSIATPHYRDLPLFGEFRGADNPELILSLDPAPDVIFKTYSDMGHSVQRLQEQTGIPVVALEYGDLMSDRESMYQAFRIMGEVAHSTERAGEVIDFFEQHRTALSNMDLSREITPFLAGLSSRGTHGFVSTSPVYTPFLLLGVDNMAQKGPGIMENTRHTLLSKETIAHEDPEIIFLDIASTRNPEGEGNALYEMQTDPLFRNLTAVQENQVYTVIPHNSYTTNHGSVLANAYYIAHVLGTDVEYDPAEKADEIYSFLVGKPVFEELNEGFDNRAFRRLHVSQ